MLCFLVQVCEGRGEWRVEMSRCEISLGRVCVFPLLATSCIPLGSEESLAGGS